MNYIKTSILIGVLTLTSTSIAYADCAQTVEQSAFAIARPGGNNPESSVYASLGDTKLLSKKRNFLSYEVQINFEINDYASSDSFPPELYLVAARGNEKSCKVTGVQLKK